MLEDKKVELNTLQRQLGNVGSHLPHIVDVEWRLDFAVNTSELENVNTLQYTVTLKTECPDQDVVFVCNESQLEDFVYKLKEIIRHCEVIST